MYYIYVLFSLKDKGLYIGFINNLKRRFCEHQAGLSKATKHRRPFELIYYEAYKNKQDALARETYFKSGWGRNYCKKILANYLKEHK